MTDLRDLLEREADRVRAAPDALATTIRRVERRRAIRRVATITLALGVAVVAIGSALSMFREAVHERPARHGLSPEEVRNLTLEWQTTLQGHVSPPIVVGGSVYAWSGRSGRIARFPVACSTGGGGCASSDVRTVGGYVASTGMRLADGVLFTATARGTLAAYPCSPVCGSHPLWTASVPGRPSEPTVADGVVYTTALNHRDGRSTLYAFDATCSSVGGRCEPMWTGLGPHGGSFAPVVAYGLVFIGHAQGPLYAFPVGCGSGGEACDPAWVGVPGLDLSFSTWPLPLGDLAVILTDRGLLALDPWCFSTSRCQPVWQTSPVDGMALASDGSRVYVATIEGDVVGFARGCGAGGATCSPAWSAHLPGGAPSNFGSLIVRDGVVYVGTSTGKVFAFDAGCSHECAPLWSRTVGRGHVGIALSGDTLLVSARGTLQAFAPAGADQASGGS